MAEKAVEDVGKAGDGALQAAQATLQTVDKLSAAAVSLAEKGLDLVEKGGEATITAARFALDGQLKASDAALHLAQKAIERIRVLLLPWIWQRHRLMLSTLLRLPWLASKISVRASYTSTKAFSGF